LVIFSGKGDICLKAPSFGPYRSGDIIFQTFDEKQQARIYRDPTKLTSNLCLTARPDNAAQFTLDADSNVSIGAKNSKAKLMVEGDASVSGNASISGHATISGDASITGTLNVATDVVLTGADCAEDFAILGDNFVEAGTVMVIDQCGALKPSYTGYDKRVAGVISGAGDLKPGITLDKQSGTSNRLPLALVGKVYCKVDAGFAPVAVGDLLTTSPTKGHAMKASDRKKAFGAVIGKALRELKGGQGLIPILVALQ
jgi:hypothetical protein